MSTKLQLAYMLTKPLPCEQFQVLQDQLMGCSSALLVANLCVCTECPHMRE